MKKLIFLNLLLGLNLLNASAQTGYVYTDAVTLQNAIAIKDSAKIRNIICWYFKNETGTFERSLFIPDNPAHRLLLKYITSSAAATPVTGSPESGLNGLSAASAIDALGTFIANRFKDEINVAFLNKFRHDLNAIPVLGSLLPQSNIVLQKSDPYNYANFMEALREAFANDLQQLPSGIAFAIQKNQIRFKHHDTKFLFLIGLNFSQQVSNNTGNPLGAFSALADDPNMDSMVNKNTREGIEGVVYLVNALRIKDATAKRAFMGGDELMKLREDTLLQQLYLTLLEQQNKNMTISARADSILVKITKAAALVSALNAQIAPLNNAIQTNQLKPEQVVRYYQTMMTMLSELLAFSQQQLHVTPSASFEFILDKLQQINRISSCALNKQYALAAIHSISLLEASVDSQDLRSIRSYLLFATNILKAESSADMQQALQNAALPVGSYRIKRNTTFNVSVNAFAGISSGLNSGMDTALLGFTAPLGVYLGWGNIHQNPENGGKSIGLFFPLIDVGAVTSFRLAGGTAELADISWANVFSPGAYVSMGLGKCPVSINLGGQMGPELSSVSASGSPVFYEKQWFWRASVLIDIPVFDFYNYQNKHHIK